MAALLAVVAVLVVDNVLTNEVLPAAAYVPTRLLTTAVVLALAVWLGGAGAGDLGLRRRDVGSGLRWGLGAAALVVVVYALGLALPATRDFFRDERVDATNLTGLLWPVFVAIPFGTVLAEEVAFRGVLLGLGLRRWSVPVAVGVSSVLFGLWHVLPSRGLATVNPAVTEATGGGSPAAVAGAIAVAVVATTVAGVVFCWLRLRSRSLLAPILLHLSTNTLAQTAAWFVLRAGTA